MSTPKYNGPTQPTPSASDGLTGWLGGFLGGAAVPTYKTSPTVPPVPPVPPVPTPCPPAPPCAPCKPCPVPLPQPLPTQQSGDACDAVPLELDPCGDAVIPVGPGPITIVIHPRA